MATINAPDKDHQPQRGEDLTIPVDVTAPITGSSSNPVGSNSQNVDYGPLSIPEPVAISQAIAHEMNRPQILEGPRWLPTVNYGYPPDRKNLSNTNSASQIVINIISIIFTVALSIVAITVAIILIFK